MEVIGGCGVDAGEIFAAILAARKSSSIPPNSPAAIADAVSDAKKIVDRLEKSSQS
jgi:hypothetical protein